MTVLHCTNLRSHVLAHLLYRTVLMHLLYCTVL